MISVVRKKNEQALQLSDKRLALLSLTQDIVFECDVTAKEIYYSENFERKFSLSDTGNRVSDSSFQAKIIYQEDVSTIEMLFPIYVSLVKDAMRFADIAKYRPELSLGSCAGQSIA